MEGGRDVEEVAVGLLLSTRSECAGQVLRVAGEEGFGDDVICARDGVCVSVCSAQGIGVEGLEDVVRDLVFVGVGERNQDNVVLECLVCEDEWRGEV